MSEFGDPVVEQSSPDGDAALGYGPEPTTEQAPNEGYPEEANHDEWDGVEVDEEPSQTEEPTTEPEQPEKIFGKYNSLEDAQKGFSNLQSTLGRQSQELGQLRHQNQMLMQLIQQAQMQPIPPAYGPSAPAQPTQPKRDPQKVWEKLSDDPEGAIAELVQPLVEQRLAQQTALIGQAMQQMTAPLQPVAQQWQMQQMQAQVEGAFREQADMLVNEYPDVADYIDGIKAQVAADPTVLMIPGALEKLYKVAKHDALTNQANTNRAVAQKRVARMPQTTAARVAQNSNDKLVDEYLGPSSGGGEWG